MTYENKIQFYVHSILGKRQNHHRLILALTQDRNHANL